MQIRLALSEDYDAICDLIRSPEELFLVYPVGEFPLTVKQLQELSKWRIEMTVALEDSRVVGFANLYNYEPKRYAFIGNVIIDQRLRGRGLGKELVSYMERQAVEKYALPEIRISVFNTNTTALLLYSKLGFEPYSLEKRLDHNGQKTALIHMKKSLAET